MMPLRQFLRDSSEVATVEAFMRWALHDPEHGYYARRVREIGRRGDFSTSATLSPVLAQAIAAWALARQREFHWRGKWHLIELGPGTGELAVEILRAMGRLARRRLTYHLIETSAPLKEQQQTTLGASGRGFFAPEFHWHTEIAAALRASSGNALIISNEFVDAFPCAVFERGSATRDWREVAIRWDESGQRAVEAHLELSRHRTSELSDAIVGLSASAMRIEIHFSYRDWLRSWRQLWKSGAMLTIDYGEPIGMLYHRRPRGTLRGFFCQQRVEGPEIFERAGHQDLTADVNFTNLTQWGEAIGLGANPLDTQRNFVLRWNSRAGKFAEAAAHVLNRDGAGVAFKVLEQFPKPK